MRKHEYVLALSVISLQLFVQGSFSEQNSKRASDVVTEQLSGLKFVDLVVYVDSLNIENHEMIEKKIEEAAKKMLGSSGIMLGKQQGAVLSIDIKGYPVGLKDSLIIQVWTTLHEEAALKRAPTLGNPHGYITWDSVWVELVNERDVGKFALREAKDQLDDFCLDWKTARDWAKRVRAQGQTNLVDKPFPRAS